MGRGYSANRSMTQRPANKEKRTRSRSVSLTRLKNRIGEITQVGKSKEEIAEAMQHIDSDDEVYASEDENETVARQDVLTKYKMCGTVTDKAVQLVVDACVTGARTIDLCKLGDTFVEDSLRKMFQKSKTADGEKMKKGLCFPTTVSVNNALCHHTPFGERDSVTLRNGDVVKVSVACHVDGYPTTSAQTIVVGLAQGETGIDAATANALAATNFAMNGMIRLMQPEMDNHDITDYITHVAKTFGVETVEAVLSNRTKRWILDGQQCIIARRVLTEDPQQNVGDCQIGPFQVWTLDVAFTTSKSYRMKALDEEVNIYRRNEIATIPRHAASEALMKEVSEKYMCFPWSPSRTENPLRTRLGIVELKKHDMLDSFPVLGSARGTYTTRASCTVAVTDKRVNVLSGSPYELHPTVIANATASPTREMIELLSEPLLKEKKVKKKQGAIETAATANVDPEGDDDPDAPIERSRKAHRSGR